MEAEKDIYLPLKHLEKKNLIYLLHATPFFVRLKGSC